MEPEGLSPYSQVPASSNSTIIIIISREVVAVAAAVVPLYAMNACQCQTFSPRALQFLRTVPPTDSATPLHSLAHIVQRKHTHCMQHSSARNRETIVILIVTPLNSLHRRYCTVNRRGALLYFTGNAHDKAATCS